MHELPSTSSDVRVLGNRTGTATLAVAAASLVPAEAPS